MYYGSGAGKLPTASAVVGDMIAAVQLKDRPAAPGLDRAAAGGASGPSASLEIFCQV